MEKRETPIIVRDNDDLKNLLIQLDLKAGSTTVISNFPASDNLAYLMEALAVTGQKCVDEGIPKEQVGDAIKDYLKKVFGNYFVL